MDHTQALKFAEQWVSAWNQHDLEAILSHYTEDFYMTTPMIQKLTGDPTGTLHGKVAVGEYWGSALQKMPDLEFKIIAVTSGVDSVSIYYHSVLGKVAMETFFFDAQGKVYKAIANYA